MRGVDGEGEWSLLDKVRAPPFTPGGARAGLTDAGPAPSPAPTHPGGSVREWEGEA